MKIICVDPILLFPEHLAALRKLGEVTLQDSFPKDQQDILERLKDAEIVIDFWTALPREVIEQLPNVKMICSAAAGYDYIDVATATRKQITITNCPGNNAESVAEHTVGLMLSAMRFYWQASNATKKGEFTPLVYKGKELQGKTVGIIGYGLIGKRVAEILEKGFQAKILYTNSASSREELEQLLRESDIISINAPLNDKTRQLIGEKEFALMKPGVVFINTGRGAIVDEAALCKYLKNGRISAAGLDVLTEEPIKATDPLLSFPNVIVTPHLGYNTEETDYRLSAQVVEIVTAFIAGKPKYIVPEQKDQDFNHA